MGRLYAHLTPPTHSQHGPRKPAVAEHGTVGIRRVEHGNTTVNTSPRLEGMHAATASTVGWIEDRTGTGSACLFCDEPAGAFKPLARGYLSTVQRLWWCRPCETTWVA
jgi:hypothetical protein